MIFNKYKHSLKEMKSEVLRKFLESQDVYWYGLVLDKQGNVFKPKKVGEIKKGSCIV